ncbi:protein mab-21-like [Mercenaria mercenaria]|uniref:protein mab-21-like n=1 Tax=Mercenaria mercenaria TaxID=6596 RepID=UPI00234F17E9|nr:protein mab-21-like [Mercenaria mercenaria]
MQTLYVVLKQLMDTHEPRKSMFDYSVCSTPALQANKDGYHYFSRKMVEEFDSTNGLTVLNTFNKMLPKWMNHGPAFKQTYFGCFDVDIVNSFNCSKGWPDSAKEWQNRPRKWPQKDLVTKIVNSGFHVVPIASKIQGTENPDLEWRISFRTAETMLVQSFSECQRLCLITLKVLVKEHIESKFPDKDFMSSYIMKTLVFWTIEETDASVWEESNMTVCLSLCLEKLKRWLKVGFCPNYFIPDYNLFRTKLHRMFILGFREWLIAELERDDWRILLRCKSFKHLRN